MEVFIFSVNAVLPVILIVAAGYALRAFGAVDEKFVSKANRLCFRLFLPLSLFESLYDLDMSALAEWKLPVFTIAVITAAVLLLCLVVPRLEKSRPRCGSMIQAIFRGNFLLMGMAVAESMFGKEGVAAVAMILPITIVFYNAFAVIVLSHFGEGKGEHSFKNTLIGIVKNPLIIASVVGVAFALLKIRLPVFLAKPISSISGVASPLALMMLGAQFDFKRLKGNLGPAFLCTAARLVLIPAIVLPIAAAVGFRGPQMAAVFILVGAPTAVSSFVMADSMGCDGELAGQLIVLTTVCSAFTMFATSAVLRAVGWL